MDTLIAEFWAPHNWAFFFAGVVIIYLGGLPLLILFTLKHDAHPTIEPVDPEATPLPTEVAEHLDSAELTLQQVGFEPLGMFFLPHQVPKATAILAFFLNRSTNDSAMAVTVYGGAVGHWQVVHYVAFSTRYRGGLLIDTGNQGVVGAFPTPPNTLATHIPWITDPHVLFEIHRAITTANGSGAPKELELDTKYGGDVPACLVGGMREELENAVGDGYLRLDAAGMHYRPTIKGAYLMTWQQLQPFKYFVAKARDRKARRMLAEVGYVGGASPTAT